MAHTALSVPCPSASATRGDVSLCPMVGMAWPTAQSLVPWDFNWRHIMYAWHVDVIFWDLYVEIVKFGCMLFDALLIVYACFCYVCSYAFFLISCKAP